MSRDSTTINTPLLQTDLLKQCHVMTPVFPLDGPCTQLCCLSCLFSAINVCSNWLLTHKWKPATGDQHVYLKPKTYFYYYFWLCMPKPTYLMHNLCNEYMLCNCTISQYANFFFFFYPSDQKTSHLSLVWDKREVTTTVTHHIKKQQQWLAGYNVFPSDEEVTHLTPATEIFSLRDL